MGMVRDRAVKSAVPRPKRVARIRRNENDGLGCRDAVAKRAEQLCFAPLKLAGDALQGQRDPVRCRIESDLTQMGDVITGDHQLIGGVEVVERQLPDPFETVRARARQLLGLDQLQFAHQGADGLLELPLRAGFRCRHLLGAAQPQAGDQFLRLSGLRGSDLSHQVPRGVRQGPAQFGDLAPIKT